MTLNPRLGGDDRGSTDRENPNFEGLVPYLPLVDGIEAEAPGKKDC